MSLDSDIKSEIVRFVNQDEVERGVYCKQKGVFGELRHAYSVEVWLALVGRSGHHHSVGRVGGGWGHLVWAVNADCLISSILCSDSKWPQWEVR